jgi:hypothetical protein
MDNQQFQLLINLSNDVNQLLLAHFIALQTILGPILERERQGRIIVTPVKSMLDWLDKIYDEVAPNLRCFLAWPIAIGKYIRAELNQGQPQRLWLKAFLCKRVEINPH